MHYTFVFDVKVGLVDVAQLEGFARIERDPTDDSEWAIESISLDGFKGCAIVPASHYLYTPVMTYLLNQCRRDIDEQWDDHRKEARFYKEPAET